MSSTLDRKVYIKEKRRINININITRDKLRRLRRGKLKPSSYYIILPLGLQYNKLWMN